MTVSSFVSTKWFVAIGMTMKLPDGMGFSSAASNLSPIPKLITRENGHVLDSLMRVRRDLVAIRVRRSGRAHVCRRDARSCLQLLLQLVEESPIGALRDQALRRRLDHARLTEPEGIEADGILRVVDAPLVVRNIL